MLSFEYMFDLHEGEECIVIGNGPSLKDVPNSYLETLPTFGSNRIYLKFLPTYFVCINPLVIQEYFTDIVGLATGKFVREGSHIEDAFELHSHDTAMFSFNPDKWVYEGHTVTFVSLQLAFFMGFTTVYLVGVDHRYKFEGSPNEAWYMQGDDPNHFDPEYFKGHWWNNPDLARSELAYKAAKEVFERNNRRIINLTENSALDVFEKGEAVWVR